MALALPLLLCFSPKSFQTRPQHPHLTNKKAEARSSCKASALVASEDGPGGRTRRGPCGVHLLSATLLCLPGGDAKDCPSPPSSAPYPGSPRGPAGPR